MSSAKAALPAADRARLLLAAVGRDNQAKWNSYYCKEPRLAARLTTTFNT